MQTNWTIRDEFIFLTQRWPYLVLAFLFGSLLGWGLARLLPATYEAQTTWYVAVNADAEPRNPDDFKNWQLLQLEAFLISEPVLIDTAERLGLEDTEQLVSRLETRWRNAGQWTLAASGDNAEQARQTTAAWAQAGQEQLAAAAEHAARMLELDRSLRQTRNELSLTRSQLVVMEQAESTLRAFQDRLAELPEATTLPVLERWNLALLVGQALDNNPAASSLLGHMPAAEAPVEQYLMFVTEVQAAMEVRQAGLAAEVAALQTSLEADTAAWQIELQGSQGLSAYLTVEPLRQGEIDVTPQRSPGLAALVGGLLGLIVFLLYRLAVRSR